MRKATLKIDEVNAVKDFLLRAGKQVFDTGKRIYYVDYNDKPHKLIRGE